VVRQRPIVAARDPPWLAQEIMPPLPDRPDPHHPVAAKDLLQPVLPDLGPFTGR
jgi:hypothetical protein